VPLTKGPDGTIRVAGSRVTLDAVATQFKQGATAEQIREDFPSLRLGEIYAVLAFYLDHEAEVDAYLRQQQDAATDMKRTWESAPKSAVLRERQGRR